MHKAIALTSFVIAALLVPSMAATQSLADVARVEEARRKAAKAPAKVYTNDDLRRNGEAAPTPPPVAGGKPETAAATSSGSGASKSPAAAQDSSGKDEKYWRGRMSEARSAVQRSQAFHDALQSQINGLNTEFVNMDDPAQRAVVEKKRLDALAEQARVKSEMAAHTKAIADIEDEARRAGVPAGWLR